MTEFWSKEIRGLKPYVPGEQPVDRKYIKLNTNESPFPPPETVLEAVQAEAVRLNLYPDPECGLLKEAVSELCGVRPEQVFTGNGSDEILAMCFQAFFEKGKTVLFPDITYSFYPVYSALYAVDYRLVPLNADFTVDVSAYKAALGGVIIANPNAPTGIALTVAEIEEMVRLNPKCVVIVDEAYVDFGAQSAVSLIGKYRNLLVVRTMSKSYSLAGLRIGWAMGDVNLIAALNTVKNSFNSYTVNRLAIAGGVAALKDRESFETNREKIIETRRNCTIALKELGFTVTDSRANFLFVKHERKSAAEIKDELRQKGILIRHFDAPRISDYCRITIGSDTEMDALVEGLKGIIS